MASAWLGKSLQPICGDAQHKGEQSAAHWALSVRIASSSHTCDAELGQVSLGALQLHHHLHVAVRSAPARSQQLLVLQTQASHQFPAASHRWSLAKLRS